MNMVRCCFFYNASELESEKGVHFVMANQIYFYFRKPPVRSGWMEIEGVLEQVIDSSFLFCPACGNIEAMDKKVNLITEIEYTWCEQGKEFFEIMYEGKIKELNWEDKPFESYMVREEKNTYENVETNLYQRKMNRAFLRRGQDISVKGILMEKPQLKEEVCRGCGHRYLIKYQKLVVIPDKVEIVL